MVEPLSAISFAIAIAFRLGAFIADVVAAGDEFTDILLPLQNTTSTINFIKTILLDPTLPTTLTTQYQRELRLRENELLALQTEFDEVRNKLAASSSFFSRTKQKTLLAHGEMQRLSNKLGLFNQSLQNVLMTHQAMVTSLIYGQTKRTEGKVDIVVENTNVRYSVTGLRGLVRDEVWDSPSSQAGGGFHHDRRHTLSDPVGPLMSASTTSLPLPLPQDGQRPVYRRPVYQPSTPVQLQIGMDNRQVDYLAGSGGYIIPPSGPQTVPVYSGSGYSGSGVGTGRGRGEYFGSPPPPYESSRSASMDGTVSVGYRWTPAGGGSGLAPPSQGLRHSASGRALQDRYASGLRSRQRDPWDD